MPGRYPLLSPAQADEIVYLRDVEKLSFPKLARKFRVSHQVLINTYNRRKKALKSSVALKENHPPLEAPADVDLPITSKEVQTSSEHPDNKRILDELYVTDLIKQLKVITDLTIGRLITSLQNTDDKIKIRELSVVLGICLDKIKALSGRDEKIKEEVSSFADWTDNQLIARARELKIYSPAIPTLGGRTKQSVKRSLKLEKNAEIDDNGK